MVAVDEPAPRQDRLIAKKDVTVTDRAGVQRRVLGGWPVPLDLMDAYEQAVKSKPKKRKS